MARQLWLLRHAEAEPHGTRTDAERRLTERGRQQARAAGIALTCMQSVFDAVLFSPKVRARQTAELAAESWNAQQRALLAVHQPLGGGFDAAQALEMIAAVSAGRVLMVGHEPDLSGVVGELTGARADLKKGGLAIVRLEGGAPRLQSGILRLDGVLSELLVLMRPRELALIAGGHKPSGDGSLRVAGSPLGGE
jgi:phosphohistidine phosphatase